MQSGLSLKNLTLNINLGVTAEEQKQPQEVAVDIDIFFKSLPQACFTDEINQALCYDDLTQKIAVFCADKSFHLIEYFGYQLHNFLKEILAATALIATSTTVSTLRLSVKKTPPIANLSSAAFIISDDL